MLQIRSGSIRGELPRCGCLRTFIVVPGGRPSCFHNTDRVFAVSSLFNRTTAMAPPARGRANTCVTMSAEPGADGAGKRQLPDPPRRRPPSRWNDCAGSPGMHSAKNTAVAFVVRQVCELLLTTALLRSVHCWFLYPHSALPSGWHL